MSKEGQDPQHPVHIYTDGVFDCFHYGHAKVLEQCKKMFPYVHLVVGVCADADVIKEKGRPIMTAEERAECVKHCKWADEVILNCPWLINLDYLDKLGCKYIAHDPEPYAHDPEPYPYNNIPDVYGPFKKANRFLATKRTEGISTTDIINRILLDSDRYIERNVKKGMKPNELNISLQKYFGVKINLMWKSMQKRKEVNPLHYFFIIWRGKSKQCLKSEENSIEEETNK